MKIITDKSQKILEKIERKAQEMAECHLKDYKVKCSCGRKFIVEKNDLLWQKDNEYDFHILAVKCECGETHRLCPICPATNFWLNNYTKIRERAYHIFKEDCQ